MSLGIRSFVELLIEKIKREGIRGQDYSDEEREQGVIDMIWESYEELG